MEPMPSHASPTPVPESLTHSDASEPAENAFARLAVWVVAGAAGALFGAALLLWFRHGATVFFDTLAAGIGACM